jgi:hypothetical protein
MRAITLIFLITFSICLRAQVVDAVRFIDTNRLFGKVTCEELKEKRSFLHQQYIIHRDQAWQLATEKSKEDYPCFWYDVELKREDLFSSKDLEHDYCSLSQVGCRYYSYKMTFYIVKKPRQPLMTGTSSGYTNCDLELLRNLPTR